MLSAIIHALKIGVILQARAGIAGVIDTEKKIIIEKSAIEFSVEYYLDQGYDVQSVESENIGYDLIASKGKIQLYIEVKGTSTKSIDDINVALTPNEYVTSIRNCRKYRIVIVYDALISPKLLEFFWVSQEEAWFSEQSLTYLNIIEKTSANLTIENG
ncbi:protein NO VEIN domain-containing protein [Candidatus Venteria ishoeyi]|uniref:protein NO VEIN domain-containing protein n=1 Tax=Candidatus Venteria ishoeyi TaxID=1899563 RepID=UPI0015A9DD62|nr:DUF3883 domain-containing protein [Candidatus Venteria ishoeyi]